VNPRIAVVGTGANGAGIGVDLVRAGHDVTFIEQWPEKWLYHLTCRSPNEIVVLAKPE
jgi:hypothetical protein